MEIRWMQAVIDLPATAFAVGADFWLRMTNSRRGDIHPDHDEFVELIPQSADAHLELQRLADGPASAHLDLLVDDIAAATSHALSHGAVLLSQPGHSVLETPGGVPFCLVPYGGQADRAPVIADDHPHAVDQICLDIPHEHFDADTELWAALTGWEVNSTALGEFRSFKQPDHLPLRILLQQLGTDDAGRGRAHLDISCGTNVAHLTREHERAGATVIEQFKHWTALRGPSGLLYCLTSREPYAW